MSLLRAMSAGLWTKIQTIGVALGGEYCSGLIYASYLWLSVYLVSKPPS